MTTSVIPRGQHHIEVSSVPDDAAVYRLIVVFFVLCVEDHRLFFTLFFFLLLHRTNVWWKVSRLFCARLCSSTDISRNKATTTFSKQQMTTALFLY